MRYLPALLLLVMIQACSTFQSDPTKDWTAKDFYDEADEALYSNDFETAIKHLESLEARYPFDPYAKQAQLNIAYSYYKFDEPDAAISAAEPLLIWTTVPPAKSRAPISPIQPPPQAQ